jgi:hypothetical protein
MRLMLYENPFQNENLDENIPIGMKIWCLFSTPINSFLTERVESNFYFTLMDSRSNQTMTNNMQIWFYKWYSKVHSLFRQWLRLEKIIGISPQNLQNSYSFWADYVIP